MGVHSAACVSYSNSDYGKLVGGEWTQTLGSC